MFELFRETLITNIVGLVCGNQRHLHQYFSYIVAVSFIGGGNRSTRRKPQTCFFFFFFFFIVFFTIYTHWLYQTDILLTLIKFMSSILPEENRRPVASHWQMLSHNIVSSTIDHDGRDNKHKMISGWKI